MISYKYTARDPSTGKKISAEVEADSEKAAAKLIQGQGLAPIEIKPIGAGTGGLGRFFNKVKTKDKILFSRQLSTLINAGLPLVQSLRNVGEQTTSKPFKIIIGHIITDVEAGSAFSAALAKHPETFNQIFVSLVAAGETSGTLDRALERLALQQEKDSEILSKVKGAMVYPAIVILVMIAVVGFMIVMVLPQVEVLYDGLPGAKLPFITTALLALSHFIIDFWYIVLIIVGIMIFATSRWARTLGGKTVIDKLKLKLWPFGQLFEKLYMARFARTGTTLVASGVPIIQVLEITASSVNNVHVSKSITKAISQVRGGKSLADSLEGDENFLDLVPNMLRIGEQSGAVEQMMEKIADYYEKEVDNQIKTISTIIEPVLMVLLGIFAFIIVAAVLLPVYSLAGQNVIR